MNSSNLEIQLRKHKNSLPKSLSKGIKNISISLGDETESIRDQDKIKSIFPNNYGAPIVSFTSSNHQTIENVNPIKVGVVLSGGQAPGGHNVIAGIYDGIKNYHIESKLFGFLNGPSGLEEGQYKILEQEKINLFRNTGGFDIIGSGRTKLETQKQFDRCIEITKKLQIDAIIIIGGDDSNTNAAILAEYYKSKDEKTVIIGVPKTIDGDLKTKEIPISFGFDTATKVYSELVGNIAKDACSAKKYWHFIKLMGRSASHIALEVGLQTQVNVTLISEEIQQKKYSLDDIVRIICESIIYRSNQSKNYGIVLIPEGLIEFIPSIKKLIEELNRKLAEYNSEIENLDTIQKRVEKITSYLSEENKQIFLSLPLHIQQQLTLDRDPHGNVQVSRIETEKLLLEMVDIRLKKLKSENKYSGSFSGLSHFFGYEGRCAFPSNFDANYTYALGYASVGLIVNKMTGYMVAMNNLKESVENWQAGGIPITCLLNIENRHGKDKPVIQKALVNLEGLVFKYFIKNRLEWSQFDSFIFPGPIQHFGEDEVCNQKTKTLILELEDIK